MKHNTKWQMQQHDNNEKTMEDNTTERMAQRQPNLSRTSMMMQNSKWRTSGRIVCAWAFNTENIVNRHSGTNCRDPEMPRKPKEVAQESGSD